MSIPRRDGMAVLSEHDRERVGEILNGYGDWFSAHLLRLLAKSDRANREAIGELYPDHVAALDAWLRRQ